MSLRIIGAELVQQLLSMNDCINVMASAMVAASKGTVSIPPRLIAPLIDQSGFLGLMPGSSVELGTYGAKVVSLHPGNPAQGLPAIQGFVAIFDHHTGRPIGLIEAAELTAIRTAAASGLATKLLARDGAATCGILGTGVQAESHMHAMLAVRPIEEFRVWGRIHSRAAAFAERMGSALQVPVLAVPDAAAAGACDIICTVTGAVEPVLLGEWVLPGAHVNLVGAHSASTREADTALIAAASLYVDLMESYRNEGGDFLIPLQEGAITENDIVGELGRLVEGDITGRTNDTQITVYNSLGITAQDLFAARWVFDKAVAEDLGEVVSL